MMTKHSIEPVYIIDGVRTPVVTPFKGLSALSSVELGAAVVKSLISRTHVRKSEIDEVVFGNVVSAGMGQNVARQVALKAGLPDTVRAYSVNNVCGAGIQSVICAVQSIETRNSNAVITGGAESVSLAPDLISKEGIHLYSLQQDGLWCMLSGKSMGQLVESMAQKYRITRSIQDTFALYSHRKALDAAQQGKFGKEIVVISHAQAGKVSRDDRPREMSLEILAEYIPSFFKDGSVTGGNSSTPSDGAAAVLLASPQMAKKLKCKPLVKIVGYASIMLDPNDTFEAAIVAVRACLKRCQLTLKDIDLFEIAESFAAQAVFTQQQLGIPEKKFNIYGGDVALGHPLGAAGTRLIVTLIHALHREKLRRGLAAICYGGGGGMAVLLEAQR